MLLGENRCGSLKGERGLIREVTLGEEGWLINKFLIIFITFPFDDVVMLLGETRGGGVAYKSGGTPSPT